MHSNQGRSPRSLSFIACRRRISLLRLTGKVLSFSHSFSSNFKVLVLCSSDWLLEDLSKNCFHQVILLHLLQYSTMWVPLFLFLSISYISFRLFIIALKLIVIVAFICLPLLQIDNMVVRRLAFYSLLAKSICFNFRKPRSSDKKGKRTFFY